MRLPVASYALPGRNPSRLVNCFAQQSTGKTPFEIVGCPGTVLVNAFPGPGRGLYPMRGTLYAVAGSTLYNALTGATLGTIPGAARLTFAGNGLQLMTDNGYVLSNDTVATISDPDLPPLASVDFCDGFIVGVEANTGRFVGSALNDATLWDALDFATAEGSPDNLITLKVDHRQVVLFGADSTEIWYNAGASGFPFERLASGFIEQGCISRLGVTKADHSVFWLANDRTIRRLSGQTAVRVSQHGVEEAISGYNTVTDCEAFSYTWNGHIFINFRFPTEGATWVFDATTNEWHERQSYHRSMWNIVAAATLNGRVYVQHENGSVGYLSDSSFTEFDSLMRPEVTFPPVYSQNARQYFSQMDVVMRTGDAAAGVIPKLSLEASYDGGNRFLAFPAREMGRTGEYGKVVRFTQLGSGREVVFRLSCGDAALFHLQDAPVLAVAGTP